MDNGVIVRAVDILCPHKGRAASCTVVELDGELVDALRCTACDGDDWGPGCDRLCVRMLERGIDLSTDGDG
jgi:hypothetical protein